ncbi:hypothetical protein [Gordonia sp. SMJS1]|uniref:DUF6924 domain-containing protein n=1 Tax=Gordonia sp. SMJS1 TaxID=3039400 RepID=UPI0024576AFD|nr:hypothetical protein [Gordonia sp. SMJS1]WGJ88030.1 hypothetical protein QAD21_24270 [Gordonia sp. SMJS1]
MPTLPSNSQNLLVRVTSNSQESWAELLQEIERVSGDTNFEVIDDPQLDGFSADDLEELLVESDNTYALVVDDETLTNDEHPLLAISSFGDSLRVLPALASAVADNLAIANLSLSDYRQAADDDGVLRTI